MGCCGQSRGSGAYPSPLVFVSSLYIISTSKCCGLWTPMVVARPSRGRDDQPMDTQTAGNVTFDGPAVYRIRIRGRVPVKWSDLLEGMAITVDASTGDSTITTLQGELLDQASLIGVINILYEL